MKRKFKQSLTAILMIFILCSQMVWASEETATKPLGQPISSYWFPADLLKWDPNTDPDALFNKSTVALAERADRNQLQTSHSGQDKNAKMMAISIMNANTSGNPSQGSSKFEANTFSYWQYVDTLVYWGGSAGEGLIVPPSADVTDAAHRNGVPVVGTVFFPPATYGGRIEWFNTFLQKDASGQFPMVDKLIQVCDAYGFDGWFINQETEGASRAQAQDMQNFIKAFKAKAPHLQIVWYDSMVTNGSIRWQNALTDSNKMFMVDNSGQKVSDSMFLNFWWGSQYGNSLKASRTKAENIGLDPYALYAGIDVQANGYNTRADWKDLQNAQLSLGLYCPSWTYFGASSREDHFIKENQFWVNTSGNPTKSTKPDTRKWNGVSNYIVEKTTLVNAPFETHFSIGNGHKYFAQGQAVGQSDWNNRSLQSVLPTYRWIIESKNTSALVPQIDYTDAFEGGNSLKLAGNVLANEPIDWTLYSADMPVQAGQFVELTAKSSETSMPIALVLTLNDGSKKVIQGNQSAKNTWTLYHYDLEGLEGKTIKKLGLQWTPTQAQLKLNLGQLKIETKTGSTPVQVAGAQIDSVNIKESLYAGVRMHWEADSNAILYDVYRVSDQGREWIGATSNHYYYVDQLKRMGSENTTSIEILPVDSSYTRGSGQVVSFDWPAYPTPVADFTQDKTLLAPGESVQFTSKCSEVTESVEWVFEGGEPQTSTELNPSVKYMNEGVYTVKLVAKNIAGQNEMLKEGLITVKANASLVNLSKGKAVTASSYVNPAEAPQYAVDGKVNTKWCAVGDGPHQITIDLGAEKTIGEIRIHHAEAGGEGANMNTRAYTLEVSKDNVQFETLAQVKDNTLGMSTDAVKLTSGRYVRLTINQATQGADKAARIYEVEVMGIE